MEFITIDKAERLSALPIEIKESNHAKYGTLKTVRVYFQELDDTGCWYSHKDYYLI